ncbi:hypothetical protein BpHYR1_049184 [Brachionus plicatilis]|uniref:Uncharacterized protein n=1 Tax=Brachionus plicatilis TaxID=10195 RepID=A0A3M7S889_BRAPC|nr:hypothetical protein BpHYR1_049184 [Brachionus plicatilis]
MIIQKSCTEFPRIQAKVADFDNYLMQNAALIMENKVKMTCGQASSQIRGILLLPRNFDDLKFRNKKTMFKNIHLHMCCMTRLNDDLNVYSHLLNTEGIPITDKLIDSNELTVILLSSYLVLNSKH